MSIATAITAAQAKVAAAYSKCNDKGATMPTAADQNLSHLANTIDSIPTGGGGHTGTVDTAGLQALGWDSYDIQWLQDHVWWDAAEDSYWAVTEANKAFGPNGATPLTWNNKGAQANNPDLRYVPKLSVTSSITTLANAFSNFYHIVAVPTHGWDTSAVTKFSAAFNNCFNLRSVGDTSGWVTSTTTDISQFFAFCNFLTQIDTSRWNTSNVTTMASMCNSCYHLLFVDMSEFSFAKVTTMYGMFSNCYPLQTLTLPSTVTASQLTSIQSFAANCVSLKAVNVNFAAASLTNAQQAFYNLASATDIKVAISSQLLSSITQLVANEQAAKEVDLTGIDTTACAQAGVGTNQNNSLLASNRTATTIKLGPNFFKGTFTTLYATQAYSWTRDSIYESLYTNQTGRDSNSAAVTVALASAAYDRLSAQDISDIATKNITLTRG